MQDNRTDDYQKACTALSSMIGRSEKAQAKFASGTAQHTLQKNRIHALVVARTLVERALAGKDSSTPLPYTKQELDAAVAPLVSLTGKSEKAQTRLAQGSWQYAMLDANIAALRIALPLLERACAAAETAGV